jgi:phosphatidylglycerophosphate synthase
MKNWLNEYRASLKAIEVEETLDLIIYRPLGFLLVKLIYKTSITPNQLTFLALIAGAVAGHFFSLGTAQSFAIGAALYFLFNVFDCSDGQLARLKRNGTLAGRIIDGIADYVSGILVYVGIGMGFADHQEQKTLWWTLLSLAALSNILHSIVTDNERNRFMKHAWGKSDQFGDDLEVYRKEFERLKNERKYGFSMLVIYIYLKYILLALKISSHTKHHKAESHFDPQQYYQANKGLIKMWTFLGPTTHITLLVISTLFYRPEWFIILMIVPYNLYWLVVSIMQKRINRKLKTSPIHA